MWPRLGPIPTYAVLYSVGILSHYLVSCLLARRLGLRRRVWIAVSVCYNVGMIVGAKALYDVQHAQFDFKALFSISHYIKGGLWGGLLVYLCLSVPLVLVLSKHERWQGTMLLWFLVLYGIGRAITEFWRGDADHHVYVGPLTLSQLICFVAAGVSILMLYLVHRLRPGKRITMDDGG